MNEARYEGLNLAQLLDLMAPIEYPSAISLWPETVGWQILALWLLAVTLLLGIEQARRFSANAYRREALRLISEIQEDRAAVNVACATIVRRTALAAYPRERVASLTGPDWQAFLLDTAPGGALSTEQADLLSRCAYAMDCETRDVIRAARTWIEVHRG